MTPHEDILNALQRLMEACDDIRVCDTTPSKQHASYAAARQNAWMAMAAAQAPACGCDKGETCRWPRCEKTGKGLGHYP